MDCREAQELLSVAQDRDAVHDATAASVAAHCRTCPECAAFDAQLGALNDLGSPTAPGGLAERIAAAAALEAARDRAGAAAATLVTPAVDAAQEPDALALERLRALATTETPSWLTRRRLWVGTGAIVASAAAVALAVFLIQSPFEQTALDAGTRSLATAPTAGSGAPAPGSDAVGAETSAPAVVSTVPSYVDYAGGVYVLSSSTDAPPSELTTVGVVQSALSLASVQALPALRAPEDKLTIYLRMPGGLLQRFDPVVRRRNNVVFQLQSGVALQSYGTWPSLPTDLPAPTAKDGSPTFIAAGTDDSSAQVYVRVGDSPERGFAIAGGTAATDPASGNPNWTWWLPLP